MAQNQIKRVSTRHEAIMDYILANPTMTYGQVAAEFEVTPAWLSVIVHSEAFQTRLKEKQEEMFDVSVVQPLSAKVAAAADLTLERYMEKLPTLNGDQLGNQADKLLKNLGYGARGQSQGTHIGDVNVQINSSHVPREVIDAARSKIGATIEMGAANREAALLHQTTTKRIETEGVGV